MKRWMIILMAAFGLLVAAQSHAVQRGDADAGEQKAASCAACHGEGGRSTNPAFPVLAGQHENYIAQALMQYKSGARENAIMAPNAASLSEDDIWDLAAYYASQSGKLYVPERQ